MARRTREQRLPLPAWQGNPESPSPEGCGQVSEVMSGGDLSEVGGDGRGLGSQFLPHQDLEWPEGRVAVGGAGAEGFLRRL